MQHSTERRETNVDNGDEPSKKGGPKKNASSKRTRKFEELAEKLVATLKARKTEGGSRYPATIEDLMREEDRALDVVQALKQDSFANGATLFGNPRTKGPKVQEKLRWYVCLPGDEGLLTGVEATYVALVEEARGRSKAKVKPDLFTFAELTRNLPDKIIEQCKRELPALRDADALRQLGCLRRGGHDYYFLLSGIRGGASTATVAPSATPPQASQPEPPATSSSEPASTKDSFARDFAAAFDELDHGDNWVGLLEMRKKLHQYSRDEFDTGLTAVRRQRTFGLEAAEGRHRLPTDEELDSAIKEQGRTLMFVTRRGS